MYLLEQVKDTTKPNYTSYQTYAKELLNNPELLKTIVEKAQNEDKKMEEMMKKSDIYIEATLKAILDGILALIVPLTTSVVGLCVATNK